jgi:homoserine O-acetyltransferase
MRGLRLLAIPFAFLAALGSRPAPVAAQEQHDFAIRNFVFSTGDTLPELRLHYITLGRPTRDAGGTVRNAVLVLHGTTGSGAAFMSRAFAGELFGPGQLLDTSRYYVILPDGFGHGKSSKPSDGLRMKFPHYTYDDMVDAQRRLLVDPEWKGGDYTAPPRGLRAAMGALFLMTSAPLQQQKTAPTRDAADKSIMAYLDRQSRALDADDVLYAFDASRNYNPSIDLEKVTVPVLAINSADDFVNPPELGLMEKLMPRVKNGRYVLIPISDATRGHGTHSLPAVWKSYLAEFLTTLPPGVPAGQHRRAAAVAVAVAVAGSC